MGRTGIAALLALGAALMIGIGDVLEQRSAQQVTDKPVGTFALFRRLLHDRRWWAGSLVAAAGFGLQAAALGLGSVLLVQALSVTSLLFALLISARVNHRRITRRQAVWATLLVAAVAVVVTVGNPQAGNPRGSPETWTVVGLVMGPFLILCVIGSRVFSASVGALLLGLMSGSLLGRVLCLDQGRGRPARPRHPGVAAHPRVVRVGGAGYRRDGLGAVGVSGRTADRVAARGDRRRARGGIGARCHRVGRDAEDQHRRPGRTRDIRRRHGGGGDRVAHSQAAGAPQSDPPRTDPP